MKKLTLIAICGFLSSSSMADSTNVNMQTSATLESSCQINVPDINFGVLPINANQIDYPSGMNNLKVLCNSGLPYSIVMDSTDFKMVGSNPENLSVLPFWISHPVLGGTYNWNISSPYVGTGNGATQNIPLSATIRLSRPSRFVTPDNYSASVTSVINF